MLVMFLVNHGSCISCIMCGVATPNCLLLVEMLLMLIAMEAGARISDFEGQLFDIDKKQILATNGNIHSEMLALLNIEDTK